MTITSLMTLPPVAFAAHPETGKVIQIRRGENGYHTFSGTQSWQEMNRPLGVSPAQALAMLHGSMFGWFVSGARAEAYSDEVATSILLGCGTIRVEQIIEHVVLAAHSTDNTRH